MKHSVFTFAILGLFGFLASCAQQTTRPVETTAGLRRIHFDFDKSFIKPEYESVLHDNAMWMQQHPGAHALVEGHCDERGTNEYNIALGDRRAKSAQEYMVNLGISYDRLSTVSFGEERPLCYEHDESCWWQNRRAEFISQ